jgi:hypothetical protein
MSLTRIPRLVWILIGLAVGAGGAHLRQSLWSGDFSRYGVQIKNAKTFEAALLEKTGDSQAFRRVTVYPEEIVAATGHKVPVHVVAGEFNGPAQGSERGDPNFVAGQWRPAYFVAEIPYRSAPTVMAYLDGQRSRGVTFTFAWWRRPAWWYGLHVLAGVLAVGIVWPTVINLLAFGTINQPPREKAAALPPSRPAAAPAPGASPEALDAAVAAYGDALEASMAADGSPSPPLAAAAATARAAAALSSAPVVAAGPAGEDSHKAFGADREDYYPTELKAHHEAEKPDGPREKGRKRPA